MNWKMKQKIIAWIMIFTFVCSYLPVTAQASEGSTTVHRFNASDLTAGDITADLDQGYFTLKATADKKFTVEANGKESDTGTTYTNRLKSNGAGDASARSIHFTTKGAAKITVYALSASGTEVRNLSLYNANSETAMKTVPVGNAIGSVIEAITFDITEAGSFYLVPEKGINFYEVIAEETDGTTEVTRADWNKVEAPVVSKVEVNSSNGGVLDVAVTMPIGMDGADKVTVELVEGDNVVASSFTKKETDASKVSTFTLAPTKSGSYSVVATATRDDETVEKTSAAVLVNGFVLPLETPEIKSILTGKNSSLDVTWGEVKEATSYTVSIKEQSATTFTVVAKEITDTTCNIPGLKANTTYTVKIAANRGNEVSETTVDKLVEAEPEIWTVGNTGSGAGTITKNQDGSIVIDATGGKIADSEDGFTFYYTKLNKNDNFTLTATFTVTDGEKKDNQSGFGVLAVDSFLPGNSAAKYMNSAGAMFAKFTDPNTGLTKYGIPGGRFVTGYTEKEYTSAPTTRKLINRDPFDWNFKDSYVTENNTNPPKFETGETYTLTLRKSNTGYHAIFNNDTTNQVIYYDYNNELLTKQDGDSIYVGVFASRKIKITVSDMKLTVVDPSKDDAPVERPVDYIQPTITVDTTKTTASTNYELGTLMNVNGTATIKDANGTVIHKDIAVKANERFLKELSLTKGENTFTIEFTPAPRSEQGLEEFEDLTSYDTITTTVTVTSKAYGTSKNTIYVSANGTSKGNGSKAAPLDIHTAVAYAQPGQKIVLLEGTYKLKSNVVMERGNNGTKEAPIVLMNEPGKRVVIDLSQSSSGGFVVKGNYWHIYGLEICNSQGSKKPMLIQGHYNTLEMCKVYNNGDTGVQISGFASESYEMWPSYNQVISVESYNNCDPGRNDADGFAAKLTTGDGNVFKFCISHHNVDDGWDLYAKSTTGSIGAVTIENCIAYENGKLTTDSESQAPGEGNGFKLGGESMPGKHILRNSISFNNYGKGVTSNSGPDCEVYNTISFNNKGANLALYTSAKETNYVVNGFISYNGGAADDIRLKGQTTLEGVTNYFNGVNSAGESIPDSWFANVTRSFDYPVINARGSFDFNGIASILENVKSIVDIITTNDAKQATDIVLGTEIPAPETPEEGEGGDDTNGGNNNGNETPDTDVDSDKEDGTTGNDQDDTNKENDDEKLPQTGVKDVVATNSMMMVFLWAAIAMSCVTVVIENKKSADKK